MKQLKVFEERVLIKWLQNREETKIIVDNPDAIDYPKWEVIRVADGVKNYKVGDIVLCHSKMGTDLPFKEDGKTEYYKLINQKDLFGIWEEN